MIMLRLAKDTITGKQMVDGWSYVSKEFAAETKELPGERIFVTESDIPDSFWKNYSIHYCENHKVLVAYPDHVDRSPFVVD